NAEGHSRVLINPVYGYRSVLYKNLPKGKYKYYIRYKWDNSLNSSNDERAKYKRKEPAIKTGVFEVK
ncbi:MAG: hypothetical protein ACOCVN_02530, partial [bacterium]